MPLEALINPFNSDLPPNSEAGATRDERGAALVAAGFQPGVPGSWRGLGFWGGAEPAAEMPPDTSGKMPDATGLADRNSISEFELNH